MESALNYWPLLLIFTIAWAIPMVLSWLEVTKVPSVIVEIIMGVIIGPHVLDLIGHEPYLKFLAYTGFIFLIFLSGLEIDIKKIVSSLPKGKIKRVDLISNSFIVASIIYFGSLALSFPVAWLLSMIFPIDVYFFAFLFPTVSITMVLPILKNDGELNRKYGQIILMEAAIATIMSIILISVYSGVMQNGFQTELLLFLIIFAAFIACYYIGKQLIKSVLFKQMMYTLEHAASQIRIRGSLAVLLLFVVIAGLINTELALGAFFAGTLLSMFLSKERSAIHFKLDGMSYGFFIPIFFIMVGVNLDLSAMSDFTNSIPLVTALIVGFYLTQILPAFIINRLFGIKKTLAAGILLTSRLGLTIATAQIGLALNVISPATNAAIVISAIVISLASPLLYKNLHHTGRKKYKFFIIGDNKTVGILGERMKMHNMAYLIIASSSKSHNLFQTKGLESIQASFIGSQLYNDLLIQPHHPVVILTSSDHNNSDITKRFINDFQHEKVITIANNDLKKLAEDSEIQLIDRSETLANHVENAILRPSSFQTLSENFGTYTVEEITMTNDNIDRSRVKELAFHPSGSLVLLKRNTEVFIPHGDTHLLLGDAITVIGTSDALEDFRNKFV